jgi:hypothetical protein
VHGPSLRTGQSKGPQSPVAQPFTSHWHDVPQVTAPHDWGPVHVISHGPLPHVVLLHACEPLQAIVHPAALLQSILWHALFDAQSIMHV